jgi:hypothetical protein
MRHAARKELVKMALADKLGVMPQPRTRLKIVGQVVRKTIDSKGWDYQDAPPHVGVSLKTLNRMMAGEKVSMRSYGRCAKGLGLPPALFTLILEDNTAVIAELGFDLKEWVLAEMALAPKEHPRRNRKADNEG